MMQPPPQKPALFKSVSGYQHMMDAYEAALTHFRVPIETQYVATSFGETHVIVAGEPDAAPVMLWHDINNHAMMWRYQIQRLSEKYRVYAPDTIGDPGRSAAVRPNPLSHDYGKWMTEVMDQLNIQEAHMVGLGRGAWLIVKMGTKAAKRIRSAVLISPSGIVPLRQRFSLRVQFLMRVLPSEMAAKRYLRLITSPQKAVDIEQVRLFEHIIRDFAYQLDVPILDDNQLLSLTTPTLALIGKHEALYRRDDIVKRLKDTLPDLVRAQVVADVGHNMTLERPEVVNSIVEFFLENQQNGQ